MPRRAGDPKASEMRWLSEDEKQAALNLIPTGESFTNFARRQLFNLPPLQHGGTRKEKKMSKESQIANLKSQIAINEQYAAACERTAEESGRVSAANQAAQHRAAADRKRAQLAKLESE